jgi:phosphoribosylformylglycinamidine (FGAM) synthase-like enzyme
VGAPPPVDLAAEETLGKLVRHLIAQGHVTAVHDVSDGGLLVALAEMAMASGIGAVLEGDPDIPAHAFWFGEDQGRYVVTVRHAQVDEVVRAVENAHVGLHRLGATGGRILAIAGERPLPVDDLKTRFETWLPAYMAAAV